MLIASKTNNMSSLRKTRGVTTTSVSIPNACKDDYIILREFLSDNNLSIGQYLVESFRLNYMNEYLKSKNSV